MPPFEYDSSIRIIRYMRHKHIMPSKHTSTPTVRPAASYPEIVGGILKQLRTQRGLDQAALAKAVGVAQPTWSRIENGTIPITVEQLGFVALQLAVVPSEILRRADQAAKRFSEQGIKVTPQRANPTGIDEEGLAFLKGAAIVALLAAVFGGK